MIKTSALNLFLCCIYSNAFAYTVEYAPQCFAKIQNHELGEIVVQDSIVHLPMGPAYTLQSGSGYIVGNRFYADQYGRNVIEGSDGKTHEIFCHFSSVKIAGGDARRLVGRKLDRIQDFAELMRFHPGVGKTDPQGPMAAGPHTTIEPRLYLDSRGILYCAYHVKDHTFRSDAATGMGLVVSASWDIGTAYWGIPHFVRWVAPCTYISTEVIPLTNPNVIGRGFSVSPPPMASSGVRWSAWMD
jgi:hypothetical protein